MENTRSCRCECPALIRLLRSKDNGWYISEHRDQHKSLIVAGFWADNSLAVAQAYRSCTVDGVFSVRRGEKPN